MIKMRLAALYYGGKDSTYALHLASLAGHEVAHLVTIVPRQSDSWMFHTVNLHLAPLLSEALGIPLIQATSSGVKETETEDLRKALEGLAVDGLVSGAIASNYQKLRVERVCRELGISSLMPLWGRPPAELLREMIESGMGIIITSVSAWGLDKKWLGKSLDLQALEELVSLSQRFGFNVCGEGGEMETLVLDAPFYKKRLEVTSSRTDWKNDAGVFHVEARLVPKIIDP